MEPAELEQLKLAAAKYEHSLKLAAARKAKYYLANREKEIERVKTWQAKKRLEREALKPKEKITSVIMNKDGGLECVPQ